RHALDLLLLLLCGHLVPARLQTRAQREAGRDRVDVDAEGTQLQRELLGEGDDAALGRRIGAAARRAPAAPGGGRGAGDLAGALGGSGGGGRGGARGGAAGAGGPDQRPPGGLLVVDRRQRAAAAGAGRGDGAADAAAGGGDGRDAPLESQGRLPVRRVAAVEP